VRSEDERDACRAIYLTFDDGPDLHVTPRILRILRDLNVPATFFVVGNRLKKAGAAGIVTQAFEDGHTIGNHSLTHPDLTTLSVHEIEVELFTTENLLSNMGIPCFWIRPPFGKVNDAVRSVVKKIGRNMLLWDNDPRDWARASQPRSWVDSALQNVEERSLKVIVLHDIHSTTADNLEFLIGPLAQRGYRFARWEGTETERCSIQPESKMPMPISSVRCPS
jgi:peptidoglycan-N-acetylglucosamine deacetylase